MLLYLTRGGRFPSCFSPIASPPHHPERYALAPPRQRVGRGSPGHGGAEQGLPLTHPERGPHHPGSSRLRPHPTPFPPSLAVFDFLPLG